MAKKFRTGEGNIGRDLTPAEVDENFRDTDAQHNLAMNTAADAASRIYTVASEAAMLALAAKVGHVAKRTDNKSIYKLAALPATTIGNWVFMGKYADYSASANAVIAILSNEVIIVAEDNNKFFINQSATDYPISISADATTNLPIGFTFKATSTSTGTTNIVADGGVTVVAEGNDGVVGPGQTAHISKIAANTWLLQKVSNRTKRTLGDIEYGTAGSNQVEKLAANTSTTPKFLISQGDGVLPTAPQYKTAAELFIPLLDANGNLRIGFTGTASARLHVRGIGATSATHAVWVENSAGTLLISIANDGTFNMNSNVIIKGLSGSAGNAFEVRNYVNTLWFSIGNGGGGLFNCPIELGNHPINQSTSAWGLKWAIAGTNTFELNGINLAFQLNIEASGSYLNKIRFNNKQTSYGGIAGPIVDFNFDRTTVFYGMVTLASLSSDPAVQNGAIYYNTTTGKFRACEGGAWANLI